ncbi:MAG: tRNA (5-methylaminomethyl-2-thiouridine)(34)-methyltransferase MnmD [Fluviicola sp.]|nr:tRNA (5-methylaminomethyl-2-thiouridine)(34)-methyltransferase MnmD [Fluviicola sp.]
MKKHLVITADGSSSIYIPEMDEHYHSSNGAVQEALHVFLENGIKLVEAEELNIFELGFGTGLNALISLIHSSSTEEINYHSIEAYPVDNELIKDVNYCNLLGSNHQSSFDLMHSCEWEKDCDISDTFSLKKIHSKIEDYELQENFYDLVFYDAFGPRAQSELWETDILEKMYRGLKTGGKLVTYCAQGQFKRNLKALGFSVKAMPGPPGKREMTVGEK